MSAAAMSSGTRPQDGLERSVRSIAISFQNKKQVKYRHAHLLHKVEDELQPT